MHTRFLVPASIALALLMMTPAAVASAPPGKVDVCHVDGAGQFRLINVSESALEAHLAHGDGVPGDAVPGSDGATFAEDCTAVESPGATQIEPGCYDSSAGLLDLYYLGPIDQVGNVAGYVSSNGICSGEPYGIGGTAIIIAADVDSARDKCSGLGLELPEDYSSPLNQLGYDGMPGNAWICT